MPDPEDSDTEERGKTHGRDFAWFRLHVKLAPNHGPVLPAHRSARRPDHHHEPRLARAQRRCIRQRPAHPAGRFPRDDPDHYQSISRIYNLNLAPSETSLTLVLRTIRIPFGLGAYTSFFAARTLRIGAPDDLNRSLELWSFRTSSNGCRASSFASADRALHLPAGSLLRPESHIEYLWLALHELVQAPIGFVDLAGSSARLDQLWYAALYLQLVVISAYLYFEFLIAFLALRKRWYITLARYTAPVLPASGRLCCS